MRRTIALLLTLLLVAAAGFSLAVARDAAAHRGRILPGVTINAIPVGDLTPEQARVRLEAVVAARLARTLDVRAGGPIASPTLADLGVRAEYDEAITAAYDLGREANLLRRLRTRWRLRRGLDLPLRFTQDDGRIRAYVTALAATIASEPRDARVTVTDGEVVLTQPSTDGRVLDMAATVARIREAVAAEQAAVQAVVAVTRPRFTTDDALAITTPVAAYSTRFVNIPNRNHNIALAAGKLRGAVLLPGEVFSFNGTVGPRTPELGYLPAPVLLNTILVPGDGGGVCQVSSTLFNVALLADLAILERSNHSRPVAYLPIGRDATVVYGARDLRFRNTTGSPLLLWSTVRGRRLTITLYGPVSAARQVSLLVTDRREVPPPAGTVTREDPELALGATVIDPPKPGYRVQTYRVVARDGVEAKREQITRSVYAALPRTIRIGTKVVAGAAADAP
ncbi:MAG: VanW family protein [Armatimonadetes bacterium]|nr:VanW family protein [Armatimonadota bacterium]